MKRHRIVVEVHAIDGVTEGDVRQMVEDMLSHGATPWTLRQYGLRPSSLAVKRYSRVVAAEYGAVPGDALDDELA